MAIEMPIEAGTANKVNFSSLVYAASTYPQFEIPFPFGSSTSDKGIALINESYHSSEAEDAIRAYQALVSGQTVEEEEAEEREWNRIVNKPRVQQALRRMAAEARRQYYAGETEEGGFGLE